MLERTSALAGRAAPFLAILPPQDRVSLRTDDAAGMSAALRIAVGTTINRAEASAGAAALMLGPDEWLVLVPVGSAATLVAAASAGRCSAVDVSHRSLGIALEAPDAAAMLNAFVALDLDLAAFPPGGATRTLFGKAEIVLWRTAPHAFRIEVARSFAPYVWDCLVEAGREFA
jgi:heterotetrameric sarcosine oxidase gamma subunit